MSDARSYRYRIVDVFTTKQFEGNALAVFPDATGLDRPTMQSIARELNLAETVFIFAPAGNGSAAKLKIFAPGREMDFAGHPTIGAGFVMLDEKMAAPREGRFLVEENVGSVPIRVDDGDPPLLWLTTPAIREGRFFESAACADALGVPLSDLAGVEPQLLDAGNPTLLVAMRNREAVDRAAIDARATAELRGPGTEPMCVFVFTPTAEGAYSRMFAPEYGVAEDPATGSSTGPLALYMMRHGLSGSRDGTRFLSEQGTKMGRRSILHVQIRGDMGVHGIEIGGNVVPVGEASIRLRQTAKT